MSRRERDIRATIEQRGAVAPVLVHRYQESQIEQALLSQLERHLRWARRAGVPDGEILAVLQRNLDGPFQDDGALVATHTLGRLAVEREGKRVLDLDDDLERETVRAIRLAVVRILRASDTEADRARLRGAAERARQQGEDYLTTLTNVGVYDPEDGWAPLLRPDEVGVIRGRLQARR